MGARHEGWGTRMRMRSRAHGRRDDGAAAVEFALILPVLLVVVFGLIQYGLYFWSMQGGSSAAREAARRGAVGQLVSCADFRTYVRDRIGPTSSDATHATITRTYKTVGGLPVTAGSVAAGDVVTVTVTFKGYDMDFPLVPFIDDGMVAQAADSRVENVPTQPEVCT